MNARDARLDHRLLTSALSYLGCLEPRLHRVRVLNVWYLQEHKKPQATRKDA